jgi:hypothetical protein
MAIGSRQRKALNKSSSLAIEERHVVIDANDEVEEVINSVKGPMLKQLTSTPPINVVILIQAWKRKLKKKRARAVKDE